MEKGQRPTSILLVFVFSLEEHLTHLTVIPCRKIYICHQPSIIMSRPTSMVNEKRDRNYIKNFESSFQPKTNGTLSQMFHLFCCLFRSNAHNGQLSPLSCEAVDERWALHLFPTILYTNNEQC